MKTHTKTCCFFLGIIVAMLARPASAAAQVSAAVQSITCESQNGNRQYCGNYSLNQLTLQRQISGSPCVQNQAGAWTDRASGWIAVAAPYFPSAGPSAPEVPAGYIRVLRTRGRRAAAGMAETGATAGRASTRATTLPGTSSVCAGERAARRSGATAALSHPFAFSVVRASPYSTTAITGTVRTLPFETFPISDNGP
jgi:hypothetical protein